MCCYHLTIACVARRRGVGKAIHTLKNYGYALAIVAGVITLLTVAYMIMEHRRQFHQANLTRLQTGLVMGAAGLLALALIVELYALYPDIMQLWREREMDLVYTSTYARLKKVEGELTEEDAPDMPTDLLEREEIQSAIDEHTRMRREAGTDELSGSEALV